jgi:hypothetical protein
MLFQLRVVQISEQLLVLRENLVQKRADELRLGIPHPVLRVAEKKATVDMLSLFVDSWRWSQRLMFSMR